MRIAWVLCLAFAFANGSRAQDDKPAPPRAAKSNVVVILADDLGYSDLGCYGSEIPTPNLDRLAAGGLRFTQFYNNARCCPSRAALLTGLYPHQAGVGGMIDNYARAAREELNSPAYTDHLSPATPTIAEVLRAAGYRTLMCGKWHLGYRPAQWPARRGFDRSLVQIDGAMNYFGPGVQHQPDRRPPMALDDRPYVPPDEGFFSTDAYSDRAAEWVREAAGAGTPFFLYLAYNAPHWPLQAPPEDVEKFRGKYDAGWQPIRDARFKRMQELKILDESVSKMSPMDRGQQKPWNELTDEQRKEWALRMYVARPFHDWDDLLHAASNIWSRLPDSDWLEAFAAHPRIGERKAGWSSQEQSGTRTASDETMNAIAEGNRAYEEKFGFVYLICATGKSAEEMRENLEQRLQNDRQTELNIAAEEHAKITALRLEKLVL